MATHSTTKPAHSAASPGFPQLAAISVAAATFPTPAAAIERILEILTANERIPAAAVEMSIPSLSRLVRGDESVLDSAGRTPDGLARVCIERIPARFAKGAILVLAATDTLDEAFTSAVAAQIGLLLDRAHLESQTDELKQQAERRIREVSTVYEIGQAIDSVEIDQLLEIITEKAAKVMDAQACSLMRMQPDTNQLTIAASYGLSEDVVFVTHRALGEGIAGKVAQTGEPLLIRDTQVDPRLAGVSLRPEIGSSMVVPMKDERGGTIGVLSIRRRRPAPDFNEEDLRLFSVFASQAALAINNKQLYDDLRRRVKELSTLSELTQALISLLDLTALLDHVADDIIEIVKFDRCCIFLLDRPTRRFFPRILRGYRPDVIGRNPVRMGEGVVGLVAKRQITIVENDARHALQPVRGFARSLGTDAFLAIPIVSKGQAIGVVVADNRLTGRPIHEDNLELLTTFVNQAGIAIENAQLYEDRQMRYQEMNQLATQTNNILRSIAASVTVVDTDGRVTRWNKASEEMWGISEEHATRTTYSDLVEEFGLAPEETVRLRGLMQHALETGRPEQVYKLPLRARRRGRMFVNILLSPLIDRSGERQGVVQIMEDTTREIRMEAEMGRIRRLADIGQLAAKMAHEVRNPLSSIKGAAQLMRNDYGEIAPLREFLDIIIDEVNGLSKITTDLLDFARPMQLDIRKTELNDLAERTLQFLSNYLSEHHVVVDFKPGESLPQIHADPKQIEQVMRNIVINAVQAMPQGGRLTVQTWDEPDAGMVCARFTDTGIGIVNERLEEVFQPFVTSKTKGTGLGLPIVRKIMENHGGRVEVTSEAGAGTSFVITLPLTPQCADVFTLPDERPSPLPSQLPDL